MSKKVKKVKTIALKSENSNTVIHKSFSMAFLNKNGKKVSLKIFDKTTNNREIFTGKA